MSKVVLATTLARWLPAAALAGNGEAIINVDAATVGEALDAAFALHPTLRGYVLDDQGAVRHHLAIFVDGTSIPGKTSLQTPIESGAEVYVMQALSGG